MANSNSPRSSAHTHTRFSEGKFCPTKQGAFCHSSTIWVTQPRQQEKPRLTYTVPHASDAWRPAPRLVTQTQPAAKTHNVYLALEEVAGHGRRCCLSRWSADLCPNEQAPQGTQAGPADRRLHPLSCARFAGRRTKDSAAHFFTQLQHHRMVSKTDMDFEMFSSFVQESINSSIVTTPSLFRSSF